MTDIEERAAYTSSLRQLADWIDAHPELPIPYVSDLLTPLHTNAAVEDFAKAVELEATADKEGNLSVAVSFGPINYRVYGYVDFGEHVRVGDEKQARRWAAENGLDLVPAEASANPHLTCFGCHHLAAWHVGDLGKTQRPCTGTGCGCTDLTRAD